MVAVKTRMNWANANTIMLHNYHSKWYRYCQLLTKFLTTAYSNHDNIEKTRNNTYLEPQTTIYIWLFQLDDSKSLYRKWLFHQTSIIYGCLGFQVSITMTSLAATTSPQPSGHRPQGQWDLPRPWRGNGPERRGNPPPGQLEAVQMGSVSKTQDHDIPYDTWVVYRDPGSLWIADYLIIICI